MNSGKSKRRPVDEAWEIYERKVVPVNASAVQRDEMKKSFYAGSASLFFMITNSLEDGEEATARDLQLMDDIQDNITGYFAEMESKLTT